MTKLQNIAKNSKFSKMILLMGVMLLLVSISIQAEASYVVTVKYQWDKVTDWDYPTTSFITNEYYKDLIFVNGYEVDEQWSEDATTWQDSLANRTRLRYHRTFLTY